jgi:hypothetical protein
MHQFELGLGQFKVVGFLDKVVSVVHFMKMSIVVTVDSDITQAAVLSLIEHLILDDVPGMY